MTTNSEQSPYRGNNKSGTVYKDTVQKKLLEESSKVLKLVDEIVSLKELMCVKDQKIMELESKLSHVSRGYDSQAQTSNSLKEKLNYVATLLKSKDELLISYEKAQLGLRQEINELTKDYESVIEERAEAMEALEEAHEERESGKGSKIVPAAILILIALGAASCLKLLFSYS
jgi:chromosome segregation ATPase